MDTQPIKRGHGIQRFKGFHLRPEDEPLISRLKPKYQAVLRATGTMEQIAQHLAVEVGTAKSRLHRAKAALVAARERAGII